MYAALFLSTASQALLQPNWIAGPASFLVFTAVYLTRVGKEEAMMAERFGDEYRAYMSRTDKLLPGVY